MSCPACDGDLVPVQTENHYGTRLVVDACAQCRGYWLKAIEPVGIGFEAVKALEGDADLAAIATEPRSDFRGCPTCGTALEEISGGLVPEGLHIDTCNTCRGMWFDRGELLVYKSALEAKRQTMRDEELGRKKKRHLENRVVAALNSKGGAAMTGLGLAGAIDALIDHLPDRG